MKKPKPDPLDRAALMRVAVDLLSRREHSRQELWRKLSPRAADAADVDSVLTDLSERHWQSDERFSESFLRSRVARGHGPVRVRQALREKGIKDELVKQSLDACDQDWYQLASDVAAKKRANLKGEPEELKAKLYRFLAYRGFSLDQIQAVIERVSIKDTCD
jgi:regulatory protein